MNATDAIDDHLEVVAYGACARGWQSREVVFGALLRSGPRWILQVSIRGLGDLSELLSFATELTDQGDVNVAITNIDLLGSSPEKAYSWLIDMARKRGVLRLVPEHEQDGAADSFKKALGALSPWRSVHGISEALQDDTNGVPEVHVVRNAEFQFSLSHHSLSDSWLTAKLLRSGGRWLLQVAIQGARESWSGGVHFDHDQWHGFGEPAELLSFATELTDKADVEVAITNIDLLGGSPDDAHSWFIDMARKHGVLTLVPEYLQDDAARSLKNALAGHIAGDIAHAQDLARKLRSGHNLDRLDEGTARALLAGAPFVLGYWSAIKLLLKTGVAFRFPQEAGSALAQLSLLANGSLASQMKDRHVHQARFERVDELEKALPVASPATVQYMTRRLRRDLQSLTQTDPDRYAAIAASFLCAFDGPIVPLSYIPSFILYGHEGTQRRHGWRVRRVAFDESRPPAHLPIWSRHLDLVRTVFSEVHYSWEIFHWAFGLLAHHGQLPETLEGPQINCALRQPKSAAARLASATLANNPGVNGVSEQAWCAFFEHAIPEQFTRALTTLGNEETFACWSLTKTSRSIAQALQTTLIAENIDSERLRMIGRLYIMAAAVADQGMLAWGFNRRDVAMPIAARLTLGAAVGDPLETAELLNELPTGVVLQAFFEISANLEISDGDVDPLADHVLLSSSRSDARLFAFLCFADGNRRSAHLGWRLLQRAQPPDRWFVTDEHHPEYYSLAPGYGWRPPSEWSAESLLLGLLDTQDVEIVLHALDGLLSLDWLEIPNETIANVLSLHPLAPQVVWTGLSEGTPAADAFMTAIGDASVRATVLSGVSPEWVRQGGPEHEALLLEWLATDEALEQEMLVACIESPLERVQRLGIEQITQAGLLPDLWLQLAETGTPVALEATRNYLASLRGSEHIQAVLLAIDSSAPPLRDLGLSFLDGDQRMTDQGAVWVALAESDDPVVQRRVVEEALAGREIPRLADLDRRVLQRRRQGRATKELVKTRIESSPTGEALSPERTSALLDMARGRNRRDRSWALQRIALLAVAGVTLDGVDVTLTRGEDD